MLLGRTRLWRDVKAMSISVAVWVLVAGVWSVAHGQGQWTPMGGASDLYKNRFRFDNERPTGASPTSRVFQSRSQTTQQPTTSRLAYPSLPTVQPTSQPVTPVKPTGNSLFQQPQTAAPQSYPSTQPARLAATPLPAPVSQSRNSTPTWSSGLGSPASAAVPSFSSFQSYPGAAQSPSVRQDRTPSIAGSAPSVFQTPSSLGTPAYLAAQPGAAFGQTPISVVQQPSVVMPSTFTPMDWTTPLSTPLQQPAFTPVQQPTFAPLFNQTPQKP